jgi:hypothetical protein
MSFSFTSPSASDDSPAEVTADSPSLSPIGATALEEGGDGDEDEEIIAHSLIGMGAGEPVKTTTRGSNHPSYSSRPKRVLSRLHEPDQDNEEESEKKDRSLSLAIKRKVLHFTVSGRDCGNV